MSKLTKRQLVTRIVLGVIAAFILIGLFFVWRWTSTPGYWRDNQTKMQQQVDQLPQLANQFESKMLGDASMLDTEGNVDQLIVPYDLANAWLRTKFPKWMANQGYTIPPPFSDFMIASQDAMPVVAFRLKTPEIDQVISMRFAVDINGDQAHVRLYDSSAGQMGIPLKSVVEHLQNKLPAYNIDPLIKLMRGITFEPVRKHPGHDDRDIRLIGIEPRENELVLTFRAQRR